MVDKEVILPEGEGSTHYSIYGSLEVMKKCFGQRLPIPFHSTAIVRLCKSKHRHRDQVLTRAHGE